MKNESGLLLAPSIINNSAPIAEETLLYCTFFDLSGILTIETENGSLIPKRQNWHFQSSFILMPKSEKLTRVYQNFPYTALILKGRYDSNYFEILHYH